MAAATADREAQRSDGALKAHQMKGGVKIYKGTLVCADTNGYSRPATDTANYRFQGVAYEQIDNTAGADGAVKCRVQKGGEYLFAYGPANATQAKVGLPVNIVDDSTVTDAATTNNIACGTIAEVVSAALVRVRIGGYTK